MLQTPIDIFIGYDNRLFYDGLASLISSKPTYNVIGGAENGEDTVRRLKIKPGEIVVIELEFPTNRSIEYLANLHYEFPDQRMVLISAICNNGNISAVMDTGIDAFILKKCNREDLYNTLEHAAEGKKYYCATVTQFLLKEYRTLSHDNKQLLTQREIQILQKLVNGNSNKSISEDLEISESTVKTHRKNLMHKVGAYNLLSLVRYACRSNLIDFGNDSFCASCPYKQ
jgi:DNA-binding NarL/FixJ family response regulator